MQSLRGIAGIGRRQCSQVFLYYNSRIASKEFSKIGKEKSVEILKLLQNYDMKGFELKMRNQTSASVEMAKTCCAATVHPLCRVFDILQVPSVPFEEKLVWRGNLAAIFVVSVIVGNVTAEAHKHEFKERSAINDAA